MREKQQKRTKNKQIRAGKKRKAEFNMFILSMIPMDVHSALKNLAT